MGAKSLFIRAHISLKLLKGLPSEASAHGQWGDRCALEKDRCPGLFPAITTEPIVRVQAGVWKSQWFALRCISSPPWVELVAGDPSRGLRNSFAKLLLIEMGCFSVFF